MKSLGKFKIFSYVKPSATATMVSHQIGMFVSKELDQPIIWNADIAGEDLDTLIIIAGGAVFCPHRDALGRAVLRSERVIYVSSDYISKLPAIKSTAQTFYRKAFRLRHKRGMRPIDHWSTVEIRSRVTPGSALINWNALGWNPTFGWKSKNKTLLYYGSWRKNRIPTFDRYFIRPTVDTVVANNSGRFEARYPDCTHTEMTRAKLATWLATGGLGLMIEDPISHRENLSPPCRFYEMLGAGIPMVFEAASAKMFSLGGYDISTSCIESPKELPAMMRRRLEIAKHQSRWRRDYVDELKTQFHKTVRAYR
jgi:hypothetical protein